MPVYARALAKDLGNQVIVGMRPEDLEVTDSRQGLAVMVDVVEELGADAYVYGQARPPADAELEDGDGARQAVHRPRRRPASARRRARPSTSSREQGHVHMFDADSGLRHGRLTDVTPDGVTGEAAAPSVPPLAVSRTRH